MAGRARAWPRITWPSGSSAAAACASSSSPTSISRCRRPTRTSSWSAPAPGSRRSAPSCRSAAPPQANGRSWLFFGDRNFTHDFLYQLEWQDALKNGALTRMDVAFSRDTPEKVYVQHKLWDNRARAGRMARRRRAFLRLRRRQSHGEGRARDAGARLCRREGAVAGGGRTGGWRWSATSATCRTPIEPDVREWTANDRRSLAQRAHQGGERLPARHASPRACARRSPAPSPRTTSSW